MRNNKIIVRVITVVLSIMIIFTYFINFNKKVYAKSETPGNIILADFFNNEEVIRRNVNFIGETVFTSTLDNGDVTQIRQSINNNLSGINSRIQQLQIEYNKLKSDPVGGRNILATIVILGYYANAYNELIGFIETNKSHEKFEYLNRYFYNVLTAKTTADWLKELSGVAQ